MPAASPSATRNEAAPRVRRSLLLGSTLSWWRHQPPHERLAIALEEPDDAARSSARHPTLPPPSRWFPAETQRWIDQRDLDASRCASPDSAWGAISRTCLDARGGSASEVTIKLVPDEGLPRYDPAHRPPPPSSGRTKAPLLPRLNHLATSALVAATTPSNRHAACVAEFFSATRTFACAASGSPRTLSNSCCAASNSAFAFTPAGITGAAEPHSILPVQSERLPGPFGLAFRNACWKGVGSSARVARLADVVTTLTRERSSGRALESPGWIRGGHHRSGEGRSSCRSGATTMLSTGRMSGAGAASRRWHCRQSGNRG